MYSAQLFNLRDQHDEKLMALGEMSATVVHEIRNALTVVLMGLNAMESYKLCETDQIKLRLSHSEAERIQRLLIQLLQYSKPSTCENSLIDLNTFLSNIVESQRAALTSEIDTIHFYPSNLPLPVLTNVDKLKQILINLIVNACEASPHDEVVTCRIKTEMPSDGINIEIHNWGTPIPPEQICQVTQPYMTTKLNGNGLGLFIVQQLIREQEGQLHIQSSREQGTLVSFSLPYVSDFT